MENNNMLTSVLIVSLVFSGAWLYTAKHSDKLYPRQKTGLELVSDMPDRDKSILLVISWNDLGEKMTDTGVVDKDAFETMYLQRGGLSKDQKALAFGGYSGHIIINKENSGLLLNLLWAFGLGNKNPILESGPISDPKYGGAEHMASTGGWSLSHGIPMDHFNMHQFVTLTGDQQALVEKVAVNIFRPCCDNSTHFPDCNHGMAMLGLLELMAANNASEESMYKTALAVNNFWFPEQYEIIGSFLQSKGSSLSSATPKDIVGKKFSSGSGYQQIASMVTIPKTQGNGGGCTA